MITSKKLLVLLKLNLRMALLFQAQIACSITAISLVLSIAIILLLRIPLLKMGHKLLKGIWDLVLIACGSAIHLIC